MNVIVQPANMNNAQRQVNQPTYMKMVTVNSPQHHQQLMHQQQQQQQQTVMIPRVSTPVNARPQMMPVILNTGYRPQMTSQPQSVIIQNTNPPPLRPANVQQSSPGMIQQQHTQQVIIDPRTFMQVQQTGQQNQIQIQQPQQQQQQQGVVMNTPRTTVQYRLVQAKPQGTVAQGATSTVTTQNSNVRYTRPQQQQQQGQQRPMLLNGPRMGVPRIIRPQVRMVRTAGGLQAVRVVRPNGGQQKPRLIAPPTTAALANVLTAKLSQAKLQQGVKTAPGSIQQNVVRKASPITTAPRPYSPVINTPRASTPTQARSPAPPPQSWSPMVEVRQPHSGGGDSKSDDDIENSLSTAILHRQPQDMMNR